MPGIRSADSVLHSCIRSQLLDAIGPTCVRPFRHHGCFLLPQCISEGGGYGGSKRRLLVLTRLAGEPTRAFNTDIASLATAASLRLATRIRRSASFGVACPDIALFLKCKRPLKGPFAIHTASFAAFTGRALTIFRAGLALNIIGSPLNGLVPARALVAGFLITTNLANPGTRKTPVFFSSL